MTVRGWALDPDTDAPIGVHVYVGNTGGAYVANVPRRDLVAAFPGVGEAHGFAIDRALPESGAQVCVYAINDGPGENSLLGCRFVTPSGGSKIPVGSLDSVTAANGTVTVSGWAADPDTSDPIAVHVYVGSSGHALVADRRRPDVGAAYPLFGESRGFVGSLPVAPGARNVCVYAIDDKGINNVLLGCRQL